MVNMLPLEMNPRNVPARYNAWGVLGRNAMNCTTERGSGPLRFHFLIMFT